MIIRKKVLIIYDYFYPGYRAGGPVQSLTNLAVELNSDYEIYVITSNHDLLSPEKYEGVITNRWNKTKLPGNISTQVFYADKTYPKKSYLKIISQIEPAVIYFNNIFSYYFFRLPLLALKGRPGDYKILICPRGMLQQGALAVKPLKKKIYLAYLRYSGSLTNAFWHATNKEEASDIKKYFPKNKGINIASNIPHAPLKEIFCPAKEQGAVHLAFLSLITEKKNLLLLLQVLLALNKNIVLHIYGPVTDKKYWSQCKSVMQQMPEMVQYKGEVYPDNVQHLLSLYHALILFTKGENFGHALYESLSAGRPVITSHFTPWNELQQKKAGLNVNINDLKDCFEKLNKFTELGQEEYDAYCKGAHQLAKQYYQNLDAQVEYKKLFG